MKVSYSLSALIVALGSVSTIFAQDAVAAPKQQNYMQTIIMLGAAFLFFYFILLRPEQKRRKKLEAQRSAMQKGCRVTAMGIIGVVDKVEEKTVILKMIDGSRIEVIKAAVTDVEPLVSAQDKKVEVTPS